MKRTVTMHERIAVRAYFLWLNGSGECTALDDWAFAEGFEQALAARRAASAAKAATTRRHNASTKYVADALRRPKAPAEMLVVAKGRPARHLTAH